MRLCIIMDEAKANLHAPVPLLQLAEITDFNLFLTTTFNSLMESALNETRKKEIESLTYSPTDRQDLSAGKDPLGADGLSSFWNFGCFAHLRRF